MTNIILKTAISFFKNLLGFTSKSENGNSSQFSQPVETKKDINFVSPFDIELEKTCEKNRKELEKAKGLINVESNTTIYILALQSFSKSSKSIKWSKKHSCDELSLVLDAEVLPEHLIYRSFSTQYKKNYYWCNRGNDFVGTRIILGNLEGWSVETSAGYYLFHENTIFFLEKAYFKIAPNNIVYQSIYLKGYEKSGTQYITDIRFKLAYCSKTNDIVAVEMFYHTFYGTSSSSKTIKIYHTNPSQQEVAEDLEKAKNLLFA